MVKDDRLYAFVVDGTSRSRARIRRFCVHKRWLKICAVSVLTVFCIALYGVYSLTQQGAHFAIERENARLRAENEKQRQQLNNLNNRVEAVEDTSRRLAEISGVAHADHEELRGAGGPALPIDQLAAIEKKTSRIEKDLRTYEAVLRTRAMMPSIWPVEGNPTDGFGGRRNPFGGYSSEFHTGQDIATPWGTPVTATAKGTVVFSGWQAGYGQLVEIDHGCGLTTRYGHLSRIDVAAGQNVNQGVVIGHVGSTGRSTGPHLHYEVRIDDEPVDPMSYLPNTN
jgi:murein DD-endopeptidase MepM/ murein hydrolase activator NlpD